jgi:hypothetical protein
VFAELITLAYAHVGTSITLCLSNTFLGVLGVVVGAVLARMDRAEWPKSFVLGSACFGLFVLSALAIEGMFGML